MTRRPNAGGGLLTALACLVVLGAGCSNETSGTRARGGAREAAAVGERRTLRAGERTIEVELALDDVSRARGLMYRTEMDWDEGMLFLFPDAAPRVFWMRNTRLPLDIAFLDDDGTIQNIWQAAPMVEEPGYTSRGPSRVVLEMNQGWFEQAGLGPGDRIELPAEWLDLARP